MVTVEVPVTAPAMVPTASEISTSFIFGMLPSLSSMPAREAVPTTVPIVSNMSIIQKVMTRVMTVNQPMEKKVLKSNLNRVVAAISAKGGTKEAFAREANGLLPKKMASPAQ